ncbi:TlpA family protein disulfide reductase [Marinirhabdus gelatinilytica]|uniref:Thioredoxin n=1 Tax=Marinirhabdus gelatinilytica TaxID=1703343 RepID=A0A370Q8E7_9FLAO|nr:thioredoxin family protein [Marinirhabdus gelatinilytica]RDK84636.1 thioredoxin [Marinirhabdus gelatinilytica]
MKYLLTVFTLISVLACKNAAEKPSEETDNSSEEKIEYTLTKEVNNEFDDPEEEGKMLLGKVNRNGLTNAPYNEWFTESQTNHTLDTVAVDSLKPLLDDTKVSVFMGTWCEDSQREVPALYKILDAADYNFENFSIIAVSHDKDTPNQLEKGANIEYVPTILFIKNGDTLNRIVEYAHKTLEQDMLTILQGKEYTPAYSE